MSCKNPDAFKARLKAWGTTVLMAIAVALVPVAAMMAVPVTAAAAEPDASRVAKVEQIYVNLKVMDVLETVLVKGMTGAPELADLTAPQKDKLSDLLRQSFDKRRAAMIHEEALLNVDGPTAEQLDVIVTVSKMKYMQDMLAKGAGLPVTPDLASLSPSEAAFYDIHMNDDYIVTFLQHMANFDALDDDVEAIVTETVQNYVAWAAAAK